jgi:hypothetical protein
MPSIALLSDIHSNLTALKSVLKDVMASGAERIVFLGDIVGYGSHPAECVEWVRKLGGNCVIGNHDAWTKPYRTQGARHQTAGLSGDGLEAGLAHSASELDDDDAAWLFNLPYWMEIPGGVVAHASLDNPDNFNYIDDWRSAEPTLDLLARHHLNVGFFGHTHVQAVFPGKHGEIEWIGDRKFRIPDGLPCVVMVGSVGQNRHDSDRRACWTMWDPDAKTVEFRQVEYDRIGAARQILAAGLPPEQALRLLAPGEEERLPTGQ